MLRSLLVGAELSMLQDYVSPVFFDIMPPRQLAAEGRSLARARLSSASDERAALSSGLPAGLRLGEAGALPPGASTRRDHGQRVLTLFFHQLYAHPIAFLDFRSERFTASSTETVWSPGWLRQEWEPGFIHAIRRLYRGYYGNDDALFEAALSDLSLSEARDTFVRHFGGGDQRAVTFSRSHFHETFHEVFQTCAQSGAPLHRNFVSLGLMLGCLYAHLEPLGLAFDVRAAHDAARARLRG